MTLRAVWLGKVFFLLADLEGALSATTLDWLMTTPHTTDGSIEERSDLPSSQPSTLSPLNHVGNTGPAPENFASFSSSLLPAGESHREVQERSASSFEQRKVAKSTSLVERETICKVVNCLGCRTRDHVYEQSRICCSHQGCSGIFSSYYNYSFHLQKGHHDLRGHCLESKCKFSTKRFSDLVRHYKVKHCQVSGRFPCPSSDCKYSGENGFARKDKLMSHQRKMHKSLLSCAAVRIGPRAIQPAATRSNTDSSSQTLNANERVE